MSEKDLDPMEKKHIARDLKGEGKTNKEINWGFNCLYAGIHHGRPEAIWNVSLLHASKIVGPRLLEELVIARIHSDAMQFVEHGVDFDQAWADRVKEFAQERYQGVLAQKLNELDHYYASPSFQGDIEDAIERFKNGKLNPHYQPLHDHDTINLLCRIIGVGASQRASA